MSVDLTHVRSGILAAWTTAWLSGEVSYDDVVDAVTGSDEPHRVTGLPGIEGGPEPAAVVPLGWLLTAFRDRGARGVRLVLPVPGDPRGLPGPGPFTRAALAVGEGAMAAGFGVVPEVTEHGTEDRTVATSVLWRVYEVGAPHPDPLSVPEAEHELNAVLRETASALADLDAASWRPDAAAGAERVRQVTAPPLPQGHDSRAVRLLAQADRLETVLALADADAPGGAVTSFAARSRDEALRPLRTAVRRGRLAAYNAAAQRLS